MSKTLAAVSAEPVPPGTHGATNHTVGIEYFTVAQLQDADVNRPNGARVLVERYDGRLIQVIAYDGDAFVPRTLEEIAKAYAEWQNAVIVDEIHRICGYCGQPVNICPDPASHDRWNSSHERHEAPDTAPAAALGANVPVRIAA